MALDEVAQEVVKSRLDEATNVATSMATRASIFQDLIDECLEPLMKPGGTLKDVPRSLLITLLRMQQADEVTVLKANGLLPAGKRARNTDRVGRPQVPAVERSADAESISRIREFVDAYFKDGPEAARQQFADLFAEAGGDGGKGNVGPT
jgi:hypothetical protein